MVYLLLADGFEEIEALAPVDFLRRAGVTVETVSVSEQSVVGAHGISVRADRMISDVCFDNAEMIILPGGMPGTKHLDSYSGMSEILSTVYDNGGVLAAICAAPSILGKRGYLQGKRAICYPGFEEALNGATLSEQPVVRDGRIITAKSAGVAWEFAYALAKILVGKDRSESVRESLFLPVFGD